MAAVKTLEVKNASPQSVTLSLNGTDYDLNGHQLIQLSKLIRRASVGSSGSFPEDASGEIATPNRFQMPFRSRAQQKYMYARHPAIAKRWQAEYGNPKTKKRKLRRKK